MVKTPIMLTLGLFVLVMITGLGLASANTVVGGKIYNSDFSEIIEGAEVTVTCGSEVKSTESIADGTYAIAFNSETCYLDSEVEVSAYKGELSNEGTGVVYESEENEGEFVSVINLNLKEESSGSSGSKQKSGTWFKCGNTVCESGEDYSTCPIDCPEPEEEETPAQTNTQNDNSNSNTQNEQEITITSEGTNPGITGGVINTGIGSSARKTPVSWTIIGIILLLLIGMAGISVARMERNKKSPPKMEDGLYKPLSGFY